MNLNNFLKIKGITEFEGYSQQVPAQTNDLIYLSKNSKTALEIGFNAGHSAETLLKNNPDLYLTSFDIGEHSYVKYGKEYIDLTYPGRHTLILGDSTKTIPKFILENPNIKFDFIFIDGGHTYPVPNLDLENCSKLASKNAILLMDDIIFTNKLVAHWTIDPTKAWNTFIKSNNIVHKHIYEYGHGRGMACGYYVTQTPSEEQCA